MNLKRWWRSSVVGFLLLVLPANAVSAATPAEVEASIERARKYLYSIQKDGLWERAPKRDEDLVGANLQGSQWGGMTALAVLALLVSGESPQDPRIAPAVEFLLTQELIGTYAMGVRSQVMLLLPQTPRTKQVMRKDLQRLLTSLRTEGPAKGFYDYEARGKSSFSLSRSQYGVLGVWAAAQSGEEVPVAYWRTIEKAWIEGQDPTGGWRYQPGRASQPVTPGITAVGIATLFIVQDQLYASRGIDCKNSSEIPAVEKAIDWMTKNFDMVAAEKEYFRDFPNPTLYAVERVGVAGGLKYFGPHDWYKKGADYLLKRQNPKNGSWNTGGFGANTDTCFGILFLSRGRAPVLFNKLDWVADDKSAAGAWNRRPRDVANVTRWIGRATEREFNWQIMNLDAPIEDWHDAPILYLSGSDPLTIAKPHVDKMRRFVEEGGLVLVNADCGKGGFVGSTKKLASELFPAYEFRELPESHPIYTERYPRSKWKSKFSVQGLSNGARELMIVIPSADPAKTWQTGVWRGREDHWQLAANIAAYAADPREVRFKGDTYLVAEDPSIKPTASIKLARLRYKGNWDPEPGGWRRLRNILRATDKLDLTVTPIDLATGSLADYKIAHLTGTYKLALTDAAKTQLKSFIAAGGTLLIDAAGGSEAFARSIEAELESLAPGTGVPAVLPANHPLLGSGAGALKIAYRPYAQKAVTGNANVARLKSLTANGRPAVLFSREDLSVGLVGQPVGGILGYEPATATGLVRRIVLAAAGIKPAPATSQPATAKK